MRRVFNVGCLWIDSLDLTHFDLDCTLPEFDT